MAVATQFDESRRLDTLRRCRLLDTAAEARFDDFVHIAAALCEVPISLFSLVDEDRQWFKSRLGVSLSETPRAWSFCAHAILEERLLEVANAAEDPRFEDNPLVRGPPHIRFYAGAPVCGPGGDRLGTLCVIDRAPRTLSAPQRDLLTRLARRVEDVVRARLLEYAPDRGYVSMCACCKNVRLEGHWVSVERFVVDLAQTDVSHGICPPCADELYADLD